MGYAMQVMRVCPRCLGEGKQQWPEYGHIHNGEWIAPLRHYEYIGPAIRTEDKCNPCSSTGYLKVRR